MHGCVCKHARVHTRYLRACICCRCVSLRVLCLCICACMKCRSTVWACEIPEGPAYVCVCVRVRVTGLGQWANPLRHPSDPPQPPSCDGLSWMLMFCDGCGANKCFWHSTGSYYRSRPSGLASALMSRQVSQPQPLYQSHTLLMQGRTSATLN